MQNYRSVRKRENVTYAIIAEEEDFEEIDNVDHQEKLFCFRESSLLNDEDIVRISDNERVFEKQYSSYIRDFHSSSGDVHIEHDGISAAVDVSQNFYPSRMMISASQIGMVSASFFFGLIMLSYIFERALIDGLVGWSAVIFGVGFSLMANVPKERKKYEL